MTPEKIKLTTLKIVSLTHSIEDEHLKQSLRKLFGKVFILEDKGCWVINDNWSNYASWNGERAHRFVYRTINQEWIEGWMVCHHCDRPGCINPRHLFKGTAQDNARDMVKKGRDKGRFNLPNRKELERLHLDRQAVYHLPVFSNVHRHRK